MNDEGSSTISINNLKATITYFQDENIKSKNK